MHARTPKILGLLLTYPSQDMINACEAMRLILLKEMWLSAAALDGLDELFTEMKETELLDLQEHYVSLFDRTPSLALHLFEHIHGDSRKRGQALVDLDMVYREAGLYNKSEQTPDYLPLFLEYLSMLPPEKARQDLDGTINVIAVIGERLKNRKSSYVFVFNALRDISIRQPDERLLKKALEADSGRPMTNAEMDASWEEQFAFADHYQNQGSGGCSKAEDMLKKMGVSS